MSSSGFGPSTIDPYGSDFGPSFDAEPPQEPRPTPPKDLAQEFSDDAESTRKAQDKEMADDKSLNREATNQVNAAGAVREGIRGSLLMQSQLFQPDQISDLSVDKSAVDNVYNEALQARNQGTQNALGVMNAQVDPARQNQLQAIQGLLSQANGPAGPSAAQLQLRQGLQQQLAAQQSSALSNPSLNAALAQRMAAQQGAQAMQATNQNMAVLRAQEAATQQELAQRALMGAGDLSGQLFQSEADLGAGALDMGVGQQNAFTNMQMQNIVNNQNMEMARQQANQNANLANQGYKLDALGSIYGTESDLVKTDIGGQYGVSTASAGMPSFGERLAAEAVRGASNAFANWVTA